VKPARSCIPRWGQEEATNAVAQPCSMPAAPLAPVRAEADERCASGELIGACMAALGRTHHGGLQIESKSGQLRRYLSVLQWGEASLVQMQHEMSLVAMQLCGPRLVADVACGGALAASAALGSSMAASGAVGSACRGNRPLLRYHRSASPGHRSEGSRGSTQAGKLLTWGRRATGAHNVRNVRCHVGGGTGVGLAHLIG
jgi:hypothetical protein